MPEKLPRQRKAAAPPANVTVPDVKTALVLGAAHVAHGAIQATAQTLEASIKTFGECFDSLMGYMKEREATRRVIAQEKAATERMQIWSDTVIAEAQEQTEQVRISASLVLASINDKAKGRDAKLEVVRGFMASYQEWNKMLTEALASRADRMPLDERELLQQHIKMLLQRSREMENSITSIATTL